MGDDPLRALSGAFRSQKGALVFAVRLTPKSSRDGVDGWTQGADGKTHLKMRVRAVPEDGKANGALIKCLAKTLGIAKTDVQITAGHSARLKTLCVPDSDVTRKALTDLGEAKR